MTRLIFISVLLLGASALADSRDDDITRAWLQGLQAISQPGANQEPSRPQGQRCRTVRSFHTDVYGNPVYITECKPY